MDVATADCRSAEQATVEASSTRHLRSSIKAAGISVSRYGLVVVLLLIGVLKFTPEEATGIQPFVAHSPLMSWMYAVLSVQGFPT